MKSFVKFLLFILILSIALAGLYQMRHTLFGGDQKSGSQASGEAQSENQPTKITQAEEAPIKLDDVKILAALDEQYMRLVESVVPSVVSINTARTVRVPAYYYDPFDRLFGGSGYGVRPQERKQSSLGSGVIVSREGHIITNHHVIAEMDEIEVVLADGSEHAATVLDSEPNIDIAVLKIEADGLQPLPFGDSDQVRVGQMVFAVGNPFGFEESVTQGIISAIGRRTMMDAATEFFQSTAALNPGNSGGPLINLQGEIVGINNQIFSRSGGWQGIGLAIPSNAAQRALESVARYGRITSGYFGVRIQPLNEQLARQFNLPDEDGALVREVVADSPAAKAGIRHGDVIRKFDGKPVTDYFSLRNRVVETGIGEQVDVEIWRDGNSEILAAVVEEAPAAARMASAVPGNRQQQPQSPQFNRQDGPLRGIDVRELDQRLRTQLQLPGQINGVVVERVAPGSPAAQILQPGDVIEEINRRPVDSSDDFEQIARSVDPDNRVMLFICRDRTRSFAVINPT